MQSLQTITSFFCVIIRLGLSEYFKVVPFRTFKHFYINNRLSRLITARGWDTRFSRVGPTKVLLGLARLTFLGENGNKCMLNQGCHEDEHTGLNTTSFGYVNCIQCEIYKPKAKTIHLLFLQKESLYFELLYLKV